MISSNRVQQSKKDPQIPGPCKKNRWKLALQYAIPEKIKNNIFTVKVVDTDMITIQGPSHRGAREPITSSTTSQPPPLRFPN